MPIEDVDYLRANSVKQSYMFLLDSKDRDKVAYHTPSEYVMEFERPFENVVGLEVIDASIPRTMYNVDVYNNQVRFFIYTSNYDWDTFAESSWCNVSIDPGDYTIQTLVPALNQQLSMRLNQSPSGSNVALTVETLSNPPDIKNKLKFYAPYPFLLDMSVSMAETLGFDTYTTEAEAAAMGTYAVFPKSVLLSPASPWKQSIWDLYPSKTNVEIAQELGLNPTQKTWMVFGRGIYDNHSLYKSVDKSFVLSDSGTYGESRTIFDGPRSVIRSYSITATTEIAQRFTVGSQIYLTTIEVAFNGPREGPYPNLVDTSAQYALYQLPKTAIAPTVAAGRQLLATGNIGVSSIDGSFSTVVMSQVCFLDPNYSYWLVLYNADNQPLSVFYNNVVSNGGNPMLITTNGGTTWLSLDETDVPYQMSCRITGNYEFHELVAPGIYNMIGEKYTTLRCREIEENSYRSLAYTKYNLGLAKFRLGVVGYSENRLDFSKVPLREFHPIGKLSRLTLRFETADGRLYDFKGVNHTLTMAIHYLEPIQKIQFQQSILNPNYRGDFMNYRFREDDQEGDSDEQDEDYSRDVVGDYKKYEEQYHPENIRIQRLQQAYQIPRFQEDFYED
jgi:Family of unknown function (DUF5901)